MIIAVDFDGTCVDHKYPEVGEDVPFAASWLKEFTRLGAKIILWTMRSGDTLEDAKKWFEERNIPLLGVNENPTQHKWTSSPKAYAHVYIDDAAAFCPLRENPRCGGRPWVDWDEMGPHIKSMIEREANDR